MRLSTPGRSSTYAMNVRSVSLLMTLSFGSASLVRRRLDDRARPADHVVKVCPGRHHGVDAVFLLDTEVDDHRVLRRARGSDDVDDLLSLRHSQAEEPVRLAEPDAARATARPRAVPAAAKELLPLPGP